MTREEAITILKTMKPIPHRADGKSTTHILQTIALEMAIKALEQQPEERTEERTETHACDCISRAAAQKLICEDGTRLERDGVYELTMCAVKQWAVDLLDELPPVEPERKPGKWIKHEWGNSENGFLVPDYECNQCHHWDSLPYKYCKNCGAKMEG